MEINRLPNFINEDSVDSLILPTQSKQSLNSEKFQYDQMVLGAMEVASGVDPFLENLPIGVEVPTLSAVGWSKGKHNVDIRPRLVDKSTGIARLVDSGAQLSATTKQPGDQVDNSVRLVAVNGSRIQTYGVREISLKIGRKTYKI